MNKSVGNAIASVGMPRRWSRYVKRIAIAVMLLLLAGLFFIKDHLRTLASLRRVAGTNAYVMDYYVDYQPDMIRSQGLDLDDLEGSYINTLLPPFAVPFANRLKRAYVPTEIEPIANIVPNHHCSTVALRSSQGELFLGRNFDSPNDAYLILRVHDCDGLASISVVDIAYLNLNRSDLDETGLVDRLPLLFAPYYLMDGINRHGVVVTSMSVPRADVIVQPGKPVITQATLMRTILDYAKTTDEAVELIREFSVYFVGHPEHLMVADAAGNSRVIEFIDGKIRLTATDRRWQVCTNEIVWQKSEQQCEDACYRYRAGSEAAENVADNVGLEDARNVARTMSVDNWTMWTSIYDLTNREIRVFYKGEVENEYQDRIDK